MRPYTLYACLLAILLVATIAFSDVVWEGDRDDSTSTEPGSSISGDTGYSSAVTPVNGTNSWSWALGEVWELAHPTDGYYQ